MENKVVTIDGPCAAGKSTVARMLANKLGFVHLNSGALYRIVGLAAQEQGFALDDDHAISSLASSLVFRFVLGADGTTKLLVNEKDVSDRIRLEEAGALASKIGTLALVRDVLTDVQRDAGQFSSVVLEGRDAGTVVFPNAKFKFYLDAGIEERVKRRYNELLSAKASLGLLSMASIESELVERDMRDSTRKIAPQVQAEDAVAIDTTSLSIDEVVGRVYGLVLAKD